MFAYIFCASAASLLVLIRCAPEPARDIFICFSVLTHAILMPGAAFSVKRVAVNDSRKDCSCI